MSLLPGEILPYSEPIGRVNDDGTITIDKNWWLLFYNLAQQVLGINGGLSLSSIVALETVDSDADGADTAALHAPVNSLNAQVALEGDPVPSIQDVRNALLLAMSDNGPADMPWFKTSGFGVPTGPSVVPNFSGTAATNAQMQATIAQILVILKANGLIGA